MGKQQTSQHLLDPWVSWFLVSSHLTAAQRQEEAPEKTYWRKLASRLAVSTFDSGPSRGLAQVQPPCLSWFFSYFQTIAGHFCLRLLSAKIAGWGRRSCFWLAAICAFLLKGVLYGIWLSGPWWRCPEVRRPGSIALCFPWGNVPPEVLAVSELSSFFEEVPRSDQVLWDLEPMSLDLCSHFHLCLPPCVLRVLLSRWLPLCTLAVSQRLHEKLACC